MKTVINRSKAPRTFKFDGVRTTLEIGANEVDDAFVAQLQKDPYFLAIRKRGIFRIEAQPEPADDIVFEPDDTIVDIRLLKVGEAVKAIKACDSRHQLDEWLHQDGRKVVKDAILKRGMSLLPKDSDDGEADGEPETPVFGGDA